MVRACLLLPSQFLMTEHETCYGLSLSVTLCHPYANVGFVFSLYGIASKTCMHECWKTRSLFINAVAISYSTVNANLVKRWH